MIKQTGLIVLLAALLSGIPSNLVYADSQEEKEREKQTKQAETKVELEEVTVLSTGTERDPFKTPGEVNLVGRDEMDRIQVQSLSDALRYQPGIDFRGGPRRIGEKPVIRGLTAERILTTVDGARINFQSGHKGQIFVDMDQFKSVEVVRGPASALWGSNALGGVVNLTTRDPSDYLTPEARVGYSTKTGYSLVNGESMGSPTLFGRIGQNLEYLFKYTDRRSDDIKLGGSLGRLKNSDEDITSGLGKLVLRPTPVDEVKLSIQWTREDGGVPANTTSMATSLRSLVNRNTEEIRYRVGYIHSNPDNYYFNPEGYVYFNDLEITELRQDSQRRDINDFATVGINVRNTMNFGNPERHHHRLTYGYEGFRDRIDARRGDAEVASNPDSYSTTQSLYLQDEITLWERLSFVLGFRWDEWKLKSENKPQQTDNRINPKIGTVLKVTDWLFVESNYSAGFRPPTFTEMFASGPHFPGAAFIPNFDLKPEKSRNFEVGFRVKKDHLFFENDKFKFKNTWFQNKLRDFITTDLRFDRATRMLEFQSVNIGDALIKGYEIESSYEPLPGLTLSGNFTYTRGFNDERGPDFHNPLATIPAKWGVVGISYFYSPWDMTVGTRAKITASKTQSEIPDRDINFERSGYTVYDVFASWAPEKKDGLLKRLKGFKLNFGIDNLTDKRYLPFLQTVHEPGINPKATVSYTMAF